MTTESAERAISAEDFRTRTVQVVDRLTARSAEFDLSPPPDMLGLLRDRLADGIYRVLVLGEAKRGKSCFLNALLGADLLPTDVDVATSQVFSVRSAAQERYRLRFEDGSARPITRADLARYGSQVVADSGAGVSLEAPLRWIEVERPAPFLPPGVELLDTPGMGTLYAPHAQITRRFVPEADAVVFVLDSAQPLGQPEVDLLEAVLAVTPRVFFIQTKIDQFAHESWEETLRRNEEILRQRFGERLADPRVWPVSSTNLRAAAASEHADALMLVSRYQALADALQAFLAEMCAAPRAVAALVLAARHQQTTLPVLNDRLANVTASSQQDATVHRERIAKRRADFHAAWGPQGSEQRQLQQSIQRVAALSKQELREALQHTGPIARSFEARIEAIQTAEEGNRLGDTLAGEVVAAAMDEWARIGEESKRKYAEILGPFLQASETAPPDIATEEVGRPAVDSRYNETSAGAYDTFRGVFSYAMPVQFAAGIVLTTVAAPLTIAAAAGGVLWAAARGLGHTRKQQQRTTKAELTRHLRTVLQQVNQYFSSVDLSGSRFSRADEYFNELETTVHRQVAAIVASRVEETRLEAARLEAQAQLKAEDRERAAAGLRAAIAEWDELFRQLSQLLRDDRVRDHLAAFQNGNPSPTAARLHAAGVIPSV